MQDASDLQEIAAAEMERVDYRAMSVTVDRQPGVIVDNHIELVRKLNSSHGGFLILDFRFLIFSPLSALH